MIQDIGTHGQDKPIDHCCKVPPDNHLAVAGQATIVGSLSGVVPAHLISEGEIIHFAIKPSLWFILFYSAKWIVLVMAALVALKYVPFENPSFYRYVSQIAAAIIFVQLLIAFFEWVSRLYILTDRRIIRIRGFFNIDVFEAPLIKIQNTYLTFALHERAVSVGTILFATAGTAGIEAGWQNIYQPLEVHERVRNAIRDAQSRWPNGGP